jgi:predicted nucleic acid-binding protein
MKQKKFLLDTCALTAVKQPNDKYHAQHISKLSALNSCDEVYASIVSLYEMEYGARHIRDEQPVLAKSMTLAIQSIQDDISILPLTITGAKIFAYIKERYRQITKLGKKALIKHNVDLMVAATALDNQAILVSNDHKMFATIKTFSTDFQWEDWTQ